MGKGRKHRGSPSFSPLPPLMPAWKAMAVEAELRTEPFGCTKYADGADRRASCDVAVVMRSRSAFSILQAVCCHQHKNAGTRARASVRNHTAGADTHGKENVAEQEALYAPARQALCTQGRTHASRAGTGPPRDRPRFRDQTTARRQTSLETMNSTPDLTLGVHAHGPLDLSDLQGFPRTRCATAYRGDLEQGLGLQDTLAEVQGELTIPFPYGQHAPMGAVHVGAGKGGEQREGHLCVVAAVRRLAHIQPRSRPGATASDARISWVARLEHVLHTTEAFT